MKLPEIIDSIKNEPKVFIRFHASWCGVCKLIAPFVERMKGDERFENVRFLDVDVEESPEVKEAFKINNLPYFAAFKDGKLVKEFSTSKKDELEQTLVNIAS